MKKLYLAIIIVLFSAITVSAALRLDLRLMMKHTHTHTGKWFITSDSDTFKTSTGKYLTVQ